MRSRDHSVVFVQSQYHVIVPQTRAALSDDGVQDRLHVGGRAADEPSTSEVAVFAPAPRAIPRCARRVP